MQYGIGSYINELTNALLTYSDVKVVIVSYYSKAYKEYTIENISSRYSKIHIPHPINFPIKKNDDYDKKYAITIVNLLSNFISECQNVVFQLNLFDAYSILKNLKEKYSYTVISTVHFAVWQGLFNGNKYSYKHSEDEVLLQNILSEKEIYQKSDRIISVTSYMKDFLIDEYDIDPNTIDVIHNGIDFGRFHSKHEHEKLKLKHNWGFMPHEKIILFLGRLDDSSKGIFYLIEEFIEASKEMDNLRLVVVGHGKLQVCIEKYQSYCGKISYTGFLPKEQVELLLQIADLGIVPSRYDHCPYTILEMIANKIPLIMSDVDGINEILNENQCIYINHYINSTGDISFKKFELAQKILGAIRGNLYSKTMAENAYSNLVSKYNLEKMAKEYIISYNAAIKARGAFKIP